MDETSSAQYQFDFRTGAQTAIHGTQSCARQRSACTALNRVRARGILEADRFFAPGESVSVDVWETAFAKLAREWQLPLISLESFGIFHDADGFKSSPDLVPLISGAEASPYLDAPNKAVYKLFDLRSDGSLGKKLSFALNDEGEFELLTSRPARLQDTVEKIALLNEIGAHPTEIVGLSYDGHYLIVKQPLAGEASDFKADREIAIKNIGAVMSTRSGLRETVCVAWLNGQTWIVGDLHERNIMRDGDGAPTIIDALVGLVPPLALRQLQWLREASEDAEAIRLNRPLPERKLFYDSDDSEL